MEDKNYYDILGVSVKATAEEITAAKNTLAKRFHPDANLKDGIDTTQQMQEILEAYAILSDRVKRAEYDRKITGRRSVMQTYDLKKSAGEAEEQAGFVIYWKSANDLYDIITESEAKERQTDTAFYGSYQACAHASQRRHSGTVLASGYHELAFVYLV